MDVYGIERGLRYAFGKKVVYNNATLQRDDDAETYNEASAPVQDDNATGFGVCVVVLVLNDYIAKLCKDKKKPTLIAALRKYEIEHAATSGIVIEDKDDDTDAADTHENAPDAPYSQYSDKTVQELYDECKRRDIDVPARQRKQIYIDLLTSDDDIRKEQNSDNIENITNPEDWEI